MRKRNKTITIRCTEYERNQIYAKAQKNKIPLHEYVLNCALNKKIIVADGLDNALKEQKTIGKNLNQIAALANSGRLNAVNLDKLCAEHSKSTQLLCEIAKAVK